MRVLLIITLALAATACTRHDEHRVQQDLNATGQDLATAAHNTGQDPSLALRRDAAIADAKAHQAAQEAQAEARKADREGRAARDQRQDGTDHPQ
jgi:hypothetical protein